VVFIGHCLAAIGLADRTKIEDIVSREEQKMKQKTVKYANVDRWCCLTEH
jgi:hypothetical protein